VIDRNRRAYPYSDILAMPFLFILFVIVEVLVLRAAAKEAEEKPAGDFCRVYYQQCGLDRSPRGEEGVPVDE
jgi:hypothetical protein